MQQLDLTYVHHRSNFTCEEFDDGQTFLRTDYAVACGSASHWRIKRLAWLAIAIYPIGMSSLYVVLMLRSQRDILAEKF